MMFYTSNWRSGIVYFWGVPWSPKEKERPTVSMPMTLGFRHLWLERKGRIFGNVAHQSSVVSRRIKEEAQLVEKTHGRSGNRESDHLPQSFVHIKQEGLRWDRLWINEEINLLGGIHYNESTDSNTRAQKMQAKLHCEVRLHPSRELCLLLRESSTEIIYNQQSSFAPQADATGSHIALRGGMHLLIEVR
jgi:hypothetical protein